MAQFAPVLIGGFETATQGDNLLECKTYVTNPAGSVDTEIVEWIVEKLFHDGHVESTSMIQEALPLPVGGQAVLGLTHVAQNCSQIRQVVRFAHDPEQVKGWINIVPTVQQVLALMQIANNNNA